MHSRIPSGRIAKVKFNLSGTESIIANSVAQITSGDLFRNNLPYAGGVYDAHMGTTDHSYKCQTCYNPKKSCLGHTGHIMLNYPCWNAIALAESRKWLKLICFRCGKPIINESQYIHFPRSKRLDEASKIARNGNKKCVHCRETHPIVKKDDKEPLMLNAEILEDKRQTEKWVLLPHKAREILDRVSDETCIQLGKSVVSHPRNCVLGAISVPSPIIRPDVKKIGGGRSTNNELTTMLQIIIKKNDALPKVIPVNIDAKMQKAIFELNNAYYDFIEAGGADGAMNSIAIRLKGKAGRFRKNQMGKRVRNMCRSTITGHPLIRIDEVGVPLVFARTIQYDEIVQEFNKQRLLGYVMNGRKTYPGATKVVKKNGQTKFVEHMGDVIDLEIGDTVYRDMIDQDPVNFNRQPSLMLSNISTHFAKVILDPSIKTLLMNVLVCPFEVRL